MFKKVNQKMRLRVLPVIMSLIMLFLLTGCGNAGDEKMSGGGETSGGVTADMAGDAAFPESDIAAGEAFDDAGLSESADRDTAGAAEDYAFDSIGMEPEAAFNKMADLSSPDDKEIEGEGEEKDEAPAVQAKPGTLTAGAWDDNENWGFYRNLFAKSSDYYVYNNSWGMNFEHRIRVKVNDSGNPVKLAKVSLLDESRQLIWANVTRYDGYADLFYATDKNNTGEPKYIKVEKNGKVVELGIEPKKSLINEDSDEDGQNPDKNSNANEIPQPSYEYEGEYTVEFSGRSETVGKKLDLMFVVDTTGSMSDEITFLQTELKDVITSVKQDNSNIPVRISMNFYKDEGDTYVVDSHKFTTDIDEAQKLINSEYAEGGGDYPEAVDQALKDAVYNHDWDKDSVKLLFILLDAPPHEGAQINESLIDSIRKAGSEGIHIIPVSASGIDKKTEFLLRAMALSTDGTYVFLTNDSGVGDSHIAPTIGDYDVEFLNELMIRLINLYLG